MEAGGRSQIHTSSWSNQEWDNRGYHDNKCLINLSGVKQWDAF